MSRTGQKPRSVDQTLGWKVDGSQPVGTDGTIFDMSVGYNLEGITSPRMVARA